MDSLIDSFLYVMNANMFWQAMMMTSLTSMFIGALVYDGKLKAVSKALLSVSAYVLLLLTTYIGRLYPHIVEGNTCGELYAGVVTILLVSFFYCLGMLGGVLIVSGVNKKK